MTKLYRMQTDDPAAGYAARVDAVAGPKPLAPWRGPDAARAYNVRLRTERLRRAADTGLFWSGIILGFGLGALAAIAVTWLK